MRTLIALLLLLPTLANAASILVKNGAGAISEPASLTRSFDTGWQAWNVEGSAFTAVQRLRAMGIEAEVDGLVQLEGVPNDSAFFRQYHLLNTGQLDLTQPYSPGTPGADIDATLAWDIFTGDSLFRIGVLDSGIWNGHPDLVSNRWVNPGEVPNNNIDDDNNGFIDDVSGWDFSGANGTSPDNDPQDIAEHGTHVSGTIAAHGNNGIGVAGVCWRAKLLPVKFTYDGLLSGPTSSAIAGLAYCRTMGIKLVNCSWSSNAYSQAMYDEIAACEAAGMLLVFSAGNNGLDIGCPCWPNTFPQSNTSPALIVVGATNHRDERQDFSNYSPIAVDLYAAGWNVFATVPNSYNGFTGTSMAAPQVTGAAALLWGLYPTWTPAQIKARIMASVDVLPQLQGYCVTGGRLNIHRMLIGTEVSGGGGGGDPIENLKARPTSDKTYDVQGRRVEPGNRSGITFGGKKKATVK